MSTADLDDARSAAVKGNYEEAIKEAKSLAEKGDVEAQYLTGIMFMSVPGDFRDIEKVELYWLLN